MNARTSDVLIVASFRSPKRLEMLFDAAFDFVQRLLAVDLVVVDEILRRVPESQLSDLRIDGRTVVPRLQPLSQQPLGVLPLLTLRALFPATSPRVVVADAVHPPPLEDLTDSPLWHGLSLFLRALP